MKKKAPREPLFGSRNLYEPTLGTMFTNSAFLAFLFILVLVGSLWILYDKYGDHRPKETTDRIGTEYRQLGQTMNNTHP